MLDPSRPSLPIDLLPQIISYIPANRETQSTLVSLQRTCTSAFPETTRKLYEHVYLKDPISLNYLVKTFRPSKAMDTQVKVGETLDYRIGLYRMSLKKVSMDFIPPIYLLPNLPALPSSDDTKALDTSSKERTSVLFPQCTTIEFTKRAYQRPPLTSYSLPSSFFPTSQDSMDVLIDFLVNLVRPVSLEIYKPDTDHYTMLKLEQNWYLFFAKLSNSWSGSLKDIRISSDKFSRLKILHSAIEHHFIYANLNLDNEEVYKTLPGYLEEAQKDVQDLEDDSKEYQKSIRSYAEKVYQLIKPPVEFATPYHHVLNTYKPINTTHWVIHVPSTINGTQFRRNQLNDIENLVVETVRLRLPEKYHELCVNVYEGDEDPEKLQYIRWCIDD